MQLVDGTRRTLQGIVTSNKMDKTVTVQVSRTVRHPKYNKFMKKHARYYAHDAANECREGDHVMIEESRPYSRTKRWRLKTVIEKAAE